MSASDSVLWTIERDPQLRSTVLALCLFDRTPDLAVLRDRVGLAADRLPRMRQRVQPAAALSLTPRWVDDPEIDFDYHFRQLAAPGGATERWLLNYAGALAEGGFDRNRPLWEIVLVEGLPDTGAALVVKLHHSLTDGVGGMQLLAAILDGDGRETAPVPRATPVASRATWLVNALTDPAGSIIAGARLALSVAHLLAPVGDRRSPVMVGRGTNWRYDVLDRPFADFRAAATRAGASVNDVFVAGLTGGLGIYHRQHRHDVTDLRITLPVSIRRPDDPPGGNRFVPVRFTLPISARDPLERIRRTGEICRRWREEPALPLTEAVAGALNLLPGSLTTSVMQSMLKGVDFVATNVPGMPRRSYLAGAEIRRFYGFAPLTGAAINVSLISHAGTACIAINSDQAAVPDPQWLLAALAQGIDEVLAVGAEATPAREVQR